MKKISLLLIIFLTCLQAFPQLCNNPKYLCTLISKSENFISYEGSNVSIPTIVNDNSCALGGSNINWVCNSSSIQNESWLVVDISETDGSNISLQIGSANNIDLNASVWGPFSSKFINLCDSLFSPAKQCSGNTQLANLTLTDTYQGAYYIVGIRSQSNIHDSYIIDNLSSSSSIVFNHFVPVENECELPTGEFISPNTLLRVEERIEFKPTIKFTGEPPFYFSVKNEIYFYTADTKEYEWSTFLHSSESFEMDLRSIRNSCGEGTAISNPVEYLIYSKRRTQVSCIPFDENFNDQSSGQNFIKTSGSFISDKLGIEKSALALNGIDQYLDYPGRDLLGENYIMSLWVKPESSGLTKQVILQLGTENSRSQKLEIENGEFRFTSSLRGSQTFSTSVTAIPNEWQNLLMIKDSLQIRLISNIAGESNETFPNFEVPDYGINSALRLGANFNEGGFFKGSIDNFKYISGKYTELEIDKIKSFQGCSFVLCDNLPEITLPGYFRQLPGTSFWLANITTQMSNPSGINYILHQIGNRIPKVNYTSDYFRTQYWFDLQKDNTYQSFTHLSGECGNGIFKNFMDYYAAPAIFRCYSFNGSTEDYFQEESSSNITNYGEDRFNKNSTAALFSNNSFLKTTVNGAQQNNYSTTFWVKPSPNIQIGENYDLVACSPSNSYSDRLVFIKTGENSALLRLHKNQDSEIFDVVIPKWNNSWNHIGLVFQSGNNFQLGNIRMYLNGMEIFNTTINFYNQITNSVQFVVGRSNSTYGRKSFNGYYDDVKFFQGGLTASEVLKIYHGTLECESSHCDNLPDIDRESIRKEYIIDSNQNPINIPIEVNGRGPVDVAYTINDFRTNNSTINVNHIYLNSSFNFDLKPEENYFRITKLRNHCGLHEINDSIPFYIKPNISHCLLLNNIETSQIISNPTLVASNLTPANDRFEEPSKAITLDENSIFQFIDNTSVNAFVFSGWIRPSNITTQGSVLFRLGSESNFYTVLLERSNINNYRIKLRKEGDLFHLINLKTISSSSHLPINEWTHLTASFSSNSLSISINGVINVLEIENYKYRTPNFSKEDLIFSFGKGFSTYSNYIGVLDDIKLLHGSLNEYEISSLFQSTDCEFNFCPKNRVIPKMIDQPSYYQSLNPIISKSKVSEVSSFVSSKAIILETGFETNNTTFSANINKCPR